MSCESLDHDLRARERERARARQTSPCTRELRQRHTQRPVRRPSLQPSGGGFTLWTCADRTVCKPGAGRSGGAQQRTRTPSCHLRALCATRTGRRRRRCLRLSASSAAGIEGRRDLLLQFRTPSPKTGRCAAAISGKMPRFSKKCLGPLASIDGGCAACVRFCTSNLRYELRDRKARGDTEDKVLAFVKISWSTCTRSFA